MSLFLSGSLLSAKHISSSVRVTIQFLAMSLPFLLSPGRVLVVKPFVLVAKLKALEWFYTLSTRSMCWDNLITEVCVEFLEHFFSCFVCCKVHCECTDLIHTGGYLSNLCSVNWICHKWTLGKVLETSPNNQSKQDACELHLKCLLCKRFLGFEELERFQTDCWHLLLTPKPPPVCPGV